ncbi:MAG: GT2 family glycosyltransferase [Flavobacteriales bacterium]|jgi:GT2 family glycosyltransferase
MNVAVVILNWNGKQLLEAYLPSVVKHSAGLATIYVADNASTDDSLGYCREQFGATANSSNTPLIIIQNEVNGGYAKGYNDALKRIDADLYVLLNSDVEVTAGWLEPMIRLFTENPTIGAAQPKIKDLRDKNKFEYAGAAGGFLDAYGYPYCRGRIFDHCEVDVGQYNDTVDVQWASGACLFIRSEVYWELEGLDEDFFAHQEEIDLCWRAKNQGWRIVACGDSEVFHLGGATLAAASPKKTFYNFRNTLFALVKNVKGSIVVWRIFARLVLDGVAAVKFMLDGKPRHVLAILQAHLSFYSHLPAILKKRRRGIQGKEYYGQTSILKDYFLFKKCTYKELEE